MRETGTLLSFRPSIKVLDATMRDGGLVNRFDFSDDWVRALVKANVRAGVDYMELGYKSDPDLFDKSQFGMWKFCRDEDVLTVLGGVPEGIKLSCMADVGRCNYERDIGPRENSPFSMYRIATYINTIPAALAMAEHCHKMGYETAVNIMAISKAKEKELSLALDLIGNSAADIIYIVDSYGSIYPEEMRVIAERYLEAGEKYQKAIGIHAHNNQELAFANTIECTALGVDYLDATVGGMGRGAGNCRMELLLGFLKNPKYKLAHILRFLQQCMPYIREQGAKWGFDPAYLLTGMLNRHPGSAIRFVDEGRTDYAEFFNELLEQE